MPISPNTTGFGGASCMLMFDMAGSSGEPGPPVFQGILCDLPGPVLSGWSGNTHLKMKLIGFGSQPKNMLVARPLRERGRETPGDRPGACRSGDSCDIDATAKRHIAVHGDFAWSEAALVADRYYANGDMGLFRVWALVVERVDALLPAVWMGELQ